MMNSQRINKEWSIKMDIFDKIELQDCPICGGAGLLEEENGNSFYVACMAADLWNTGKVISSHPGE